MSNKSNCYWVTLLCLLFLWTTVTGQEINNLDPQETAEPVPLTPVQIKMQKIISIEFRKTPFEEVTRTLSEQADVDIVMMVACTWRR